MSPQNIATICSYFKSSCRTNSEDQFTNCSIERCLGRVRSIRSLGISVTKKKNLLTRSIFKSNLHLSHFCAQFHCWEWYRTKCMSNLGNGNTFLPIFFFFFLSESISGIFFFKVVFFAKWTKKFCSIRRTFLAHISCTKDWPKNLMSNTSFLWSFNSKHP